MDGDYFLDDCDDAVGRLVGAGVGAEVGAWCVWIDGGAGVGRECVGVAEDGRCGSAVAVVVVLCVYDFLPCFVCAVHDVFVGV